jgi:hypothetical protein
MYNRAGVLNFAGGMMFATGSLLYLASSIQQNSYSIEATICANSQNGCPTLENRIQIEKDAGKYSAIYIIMAGLGAGFACSRESKK